MVKKSKPAAGSRAFHPRKRAKRIYPRITSYPALPKSKPLAFAGYKAGMLTVILLDNVKTSPTYGQEVAVPATVLDCPPLRVVGMRFYELTAQGLRSFAEVWAPEFPKELERKVKVKPNTEKLEAMKSWLDRIATIRLLAMTQPKLSGLGKKKPEIFEIGIGGSVREQFEYAVQVLGKQIKVSDVFKPGELVDAIAITKGKGTGGPVKRFGVKIQPRKAKHKRRHVGSLGQERPGRVRWTVPQAGQVGFQRRTQLNVRVLKVGEKGEEVTPSGGFLGYGTIKGDYVLCKGSLPGPRKRLIMLRHALRPAKLKYTVPELRSILK